jgi:undecaprenyl-diphosphatase
LEVPLLEVLKAIALGIIQGIAEFFPVSSSGHLVLVPFLFKWPYIPVYYSVALHFATLLSLVTVFYRDIGRIIKAFFTGLFNKNIRKTNPYFRFALFIVIATIPGVIAGYFLQDRIEGFFSEPLYVCLFLLVTAAFLFIGEYFGKKYEKRFEDLNPENREDVKNDNTGFNLQSNDSNSGAKNPVIVIDNKIPEIIENNSGANAFNSKIRGLGFISAAVIGIGQAIAILPGVSRSGSTISFARLFGIKREECVRFSMLLSSPITFGAFVLETYKSYNEVLLQDAQVIINIAVGFVFAYLAGLFAIKFLLKFTKLRNLNYFAIYCIVISIVVFVLFFINKGGGFFK